MASLKGLKWTSILVLFGRTSCVSFDTSTRRPLNVLFGRPQVRYGRSINVHWTSMGPLGNKAQAYGLCKWLQKVSFCLIPYHFSISSHLTIKPTIIRVTVAIKLLNVSHYLSPYFNDFWVENYLLRSQLENKLSIYLEWLTWDA